MKINIILQNTELSSDPAAMYTLKPVI